MKQRELEKIAVYRLQVPLTKPYRLAFGAVEHYDTIIVEATDRDGRTGFGEATVLTGYTDETIDGAWRIAGEFADELAGTGCEDPIGRIQQLGIEFPFTATAFGTAFEMMAGSELLNVPAPAWVPLIGLLHATGEDAIYHEFQKLLSEGYRTIKVKVGFDAETDARLVKTVQKIVSGAARIRLDANQGYSAAQAVAFVTALDPADIELFEQPCAAGDWTSHLTVVRASPVPMMLDESIYGLGDIEKAAEFKAAAYIKVKLMKLVTLARLAEAVERTKSLGMTPVLGNGVACDPGCWMEGCIAARHIDNAGEMNGFLKMRGPLLSDHLEFRDGAMWIMPGFRPRLDPASIEKYLVDSVVRVAPRAGRATSRQGQKA
jgi:o-succinylbenzoate synthase